MIKCTRHVTNRYILDAEVDKLDFKCGDDVKTLIKDFNRYNLNTVCVLVNSNHIYLQHHYVTSYLLFAFVIS